MATLAQLKSQLAAAKDPYVRASIQAQINNLSSQSNSLFPTFGSSPGSIPNLPLLPGGFETYSTTQLNSAISQYKASIAKYNSQLKSTSSSLVRAGISAHLSSLNSEYAAAQKALANKSGAQSVATPRSPAKKSSSGTSGSAGTSGGGSGGLGGSAGSAPMSSTDIRAYVGANYGYFAAFLDIPEVGTKLTQAATEGWDANRLKYELSTTNWWRTTAASSREWLGNKALDPATAARQVEQQKVAISTLANQLGATISPDRLASMAEDSLRLGWSQPELAQAVSAEYHYTPGAAQFGLAATTFEHLKSISNDFIVPLSDATISKWESDIIAGKSNEDAFIEDARNRAKSMYGAPAVQSALDAGQTMQQIADPYRQIAAKDLEINPDSIDFSQPQWSKALQTIDPKTQSPTVMSLSDWQQEIRSNRTYGFSKTATAKSMAYDAALNIAKQFGAVG